MMNIENQPDSLLPIALFAGLSLAHRTRLCTLLHRKTFPAKAVVILEDHPGEVAYIIQSGTVKISVAGDEIDTILALLGPGEIVGEMSLIDCMSRSATAETQEECKLLWIDRSAFHDCLETMPLMAMNLVGILSRRVRLANTRIQSMATLDIDGRIARQLLAFAQEYGVPSNGGVIIPLRLTQSDLAGLVGSSRESVNHAISSWKQKKQISVDGRYYITIHDSAALAKRC